MSRTESRTKPIIRDMVTQCSQTTLRACDLATIAAFAFTKAVVADQMHDNRPPFFLLGERRSFSKTLTMPTGVQMWLASTFGTRGLFKSYHIETPGNTSRDFKLQAFTYGLGYLVIQVVAFRWKKRLFRSQAQELFLEQAAVWDSVSVPFWPSDGTPVNWPPAKRLTDELIDIFVKRWVKLERR